jgi:hypothetical protein
MSHKPQSPPLKLADVPNEHAPWCDITKFARTFNGYEYYPNHECGTLANSTKRERVTNGDALQPLSLAELMACLFFEHRRYNHLGYPPEGPEMEYIHELLSEIARKCAQNHEEVSS